MRYGFLVLLTAISFGCERSNFHSSQSGKTGQGDLPAETVGPNEKDSVTARSAITAVPEATITAAPDTTPLPNQTVVVATPTITPPNYALICQQELYPTAYQQVVYSPSNWENLTPNPSTCGSGECIFKDKTSGITWTDMLPAETSGTNAATRCDELVYAGYSDWRLATKDEAQQAYLRGLSRIPNWQYANKDHRRTWTSTHESLNPRYGNYTQVYLHYLCGLASDCESCNGGVACVRN